LKEAFQADKFHCFGVVKVKNYGIGSGAQMEIGYRGSSWFPINSLSAASLFVHHPGYVG
jgi:hypothetical protein